MASQNPNYHNPFAELVVVEQPPTVDKPAIAPIATPAEPASVGNEVTEEKPDLFIMLKKDLITKRNERRFRQFSNARRIRQFKKRVIQVPPEDTAGVIEV